jgi:hypothetical protein
MLVCWFDMYADSVALSIGLLYVTCGAWVSTTVPLRVIVAWNVEVALF